MKKIWIWLLCVVMLISLAACGDSGKDTESGNGTEISGTENGSENQDTQQGSESTEDSGVDEEALKLYEDAVADLNEMDAMNLDVTIRKTVSLGTESFKEESAQSITLRGIKGDGFVAKKTEDLTYDTYKVHGVETYVDDSLYYKINAVGAATKLYQTKLTSQEYMDTLVPAQLISGELYEVVKKTSDQELSFASAKDVEAWLGAEGAKLVEAEGTVKLNEDGSIKESTYKVEYKMASTVISYEIKVKMSDAKQDEITAPTDLAQYEEIDKEDYPAPYLVHHAIGYVLQMNSMKVDATIYALSHAAGLYYEQTRTTHLYSDGTHFLGKADGTYSLMNMSTGEFYFNDTLTENYKDGTYSQIYNGGVPQSQSMTFASYNQSVTSNIVADFAYVDIFEDIEVTNYNGALLVEYEYVDSCHKELASIITGYMLADPNLLNDLATAYRTEEAGGYIGIDLASGIPTAYGFKYDGYHTIEGVEYELCYESIASVQVGHTSSYEEITGEPLPEVAGDVEEINPLFYHVTGPDGQEMWLFGTMHIGDYRTAKLPQSIKDAFAASDALALEFSNDAFEKKMEEDPAFAAQVSALYFYSDGSQAKNHIKDAELYDYAMGLMKATGQKTSYTDQLKVYFWSSFLDNYYDQWNYELDSEYGMDNRLEQMAQDSNKKIYDVESGYAQLKMMSSFSDALQENMLGGSANTSIVENYNDVMELYEMYINADEAEITAYLNDADVSELTAEEMALYEEFTKAMETDRNKGMLDVAKQYLESDEVVFYAVGLAHLLAEDGLVNTLRDAGYTVELVTE